ncbi:MAG TPA: biotin/lipoyl-containing protein [Gemmataceae bacterium]|jgi:acetyltransferase-like isoleucine patch superfamily enzyme
MDRPEPYALLVAPREGVNDDVVRVLEWRVPDGARVERGAAVAVLETTKATLELEAPRSGYLFHLATAGAEVPVGGPVAAVADAAERPRLAAEAAAPPGGGGDQVVTKKARALIEEHGLAADLFAGRPVVRASDVEEVLRQRGGGAARPARTFRGEPVDAGADWDAAFHTDAYRQLGELLTALRKRMKAKYDRHVPTGDLLNDRWGLARDHGFGDGTSVYDDCLILGDVTLGKHCWVGPYTILDGQGGLTVGDYVDIGAGAHLYTHNTIERALTGHQAPLFKKATRIGNCCFIAPQSVIAPGTVLGDHCFVAAGSYVEGNFPAFSYVAGNPARRVGVVEITGGRARVRHLTDKPDGPPQHGRGAPPDPG